MQNIRWSCIAVGLQVAKAFFEHPSYLKAHESNVATRCTAETVMVVDSSVTSDLESIFRRGPEWEIGLEHICLLQVCSCARLDVSTLIRCDGVSGKLIAPDQFILGCLPVRHLAADLIFNLARSFTLFQRA